MLNPIVNRTSVNGQEDNQSVGGGSKSTTSSQESLSPRESKHQSIPIQDCSELTMRDLSASLSKFESEEEERKVLSITDTHYTLPQTSIYMQ